MARPWTADELTSARSLAARGAPLQHAAFILDRRKCELDIAAWQLLGRAADRAAAVLNGEPETVEPHELALLQQRVRAWLSFATGTAREISADLGVTEPDVLRALRALAENNQVDAHEGPPPQSDARGYRWFALGRSQ